MRRTAACFLVVLACAGCAADESFLDGPRQTPELRWLQRLGPWRNEMADRAAAVAKGQIDPTNLSTCSTSFDADVGTAPELYRPVERLLRSGCRWYERGAEIDARMTPTTDPGPLLVKREEAISKGDDLFARADYALESRLKESRDLPVRAEPSDDSHIDPRLGEAATTIVHRDVEVRCWAHDDWSDLTAEAAALRGDVDTDYAGFVGIDNARLHLSTEVCEPLARLVYEDADERDGDVREEIAFAVLALAHEAGHLLAPAASEAEVECHAIQRLSALAVELGADADYARRLAEYAWDEIYFANDPDYISRECRNDLSLDLNPHTDRWP